MEDEILSKSGLEKPSVGVYDGRGVRVRRSPPLPIFSRRGPGASTGLPTDSDNGLHCSHDHA